MNSLFFPDLSPLLIRLQEHARRALVLSVGHAPICTAAASWRIREDWFLQQALREDKNEDAETEALSGSVSHGARQSPQTDNNHENVNESASSTADAW